MERMLLSIDIVDYGDLPALPRRIDSFGKIAEQVHERLKAWGFYRDIKPAQLPREEDTII
jgi:hypothetical protein